MSWSPIIEAYVANGMKISQQLCAAAILLSDNTAMNLLAKQLGGLKAVNALARSIGDNSFKIDHWWPKEAVQVTCRIYLRQVRWLQRLALGDALASPQRELLQTWLKSTITGEARIRAGC